MPNEGHARGLPQPHFFPVLHQGIFFVELISLDFSLAEC